MIRSKVRAFVSEADDSFTRTISANIYLLKVNNRNTRKVWDIFKVNNKNTRTTSLTSFWWFYWQLWTCFTPFSGVSVEFEQQIIARMLSTLRESYYFGSLSDCKVNSGIANNLAARFVERSLNDGLWKNPYCSAPSNTIRCTTNIRSIQYQLTFTCGKWTIGAPEKSVKYVQSYQ